MAWTRKPYCSVDDVKALLDRRGDSDDDLITQLIGEAQAWVDARLGFPFQTEGTSAAPATRLFNGNNHEQLRIDRCVEVVRVLVRTTRVASAPSGGLQRTSSDEDVTGDVLLAPAGRSPGFLLERLTGYFPLGRQNIVVEGVWGLPNVPGDIARATARLAVHYLLARESGYEDKTAGSNEAGYGIRTFRASAIPADVVEAVDRHRFRTFRG